MCIYLFFVFPFFYVVKQTSFFFFDVLMLYFNQFLAQAKKICPSDPLVQNELGVSAYNLKE